MKKIFMLLTAGVCSAVDVLAQTPVLANELTFHDTRATQEQPNAFGFNVRFDFKSRSVLGVPGDGGYSGLMTIAPWGDLTGDKVHQLNFNNGGIFYRQGLQGSNWESWSQVLTSSGNQALGGRLVINSGLDNILSLNNSESNSWSYIEYFSPAGRRAYIGTNPSYDLEIGKEMGGNIIMSGANVGIGISQPTYKLTVGGTIGARKVKVTQETWSDFVFADDYRLSSLYELEQYIKTNKHLPEIPSEQDVQQDGLDLGEINKKLLQKLEEFSLYLIEHQKTLDALKAENAQLKEEIKRMK